MSFPAHCTFVCVRVHVCVGECVWIHRRVCVCAHLWVHACVWGERGYMCGCIYFLSFSHHRLVLKIRKSKDISFTIMLLPSNAWRMLSTRWIFFHWSAHEIQASILLTISWSCCWNPKYLGSHRNAMFTPERADGTLDKTEQNKSPPFGLAGEFLPNNRGTASRKHSSNNFPILRNDILTS